MFQVFQVVFDAGAGVFSVNMIAAPSETAATIYAQAHARRHGYTAGQPRKLEEWEARERRAKHMPCITVDSEGRLTK